MKVADRLPPPAPAKAIGLETVGMTMRFGAFTALDDVSIRVPAGTFHALLGENGAGKSTLVKCIMGFYQPTDGQLIVAGHEAPIADTRTAHALGLGMVYQHFTLVPSLTAAENLVIAREAGPAVIDWRRERASLDAFMATMPFRVPLDVPVARLAAGEKQKLEILKQLNLGRRFLILDEPTSVLTPQEADEVLSVVRALTRAGEITVLMITHKFREVSAFADDVSVLRRGRLAGTGRVADLSHGEMAAMMVGSALAVRGPTRAGRPPGAEMLRLDKVTAPRRSGGGQITIEDLAVRSGEIVGVAGVSGNGQGELVEVLAGQRPVTAGSVTVRGARYHATRAETRALRVRTLPEEPLRNACAPRMSVVENIAFRTFDDRRAIFLRRGAMHRRSAELIAAFKVKASSPDAPIASLSGGNVQRAVLARELSGEVDLIVVANPCFGLDFSAVAEVRARLLAARDAGAAILLISEDLDEVLELSDRVVVMSEGQIAYEVAAAEADVAEIGRHMGGHA